MLETAQVTTTRMIAISAAMRMIGTAEKQPADASIRRAARVRGLLGTDEHGRAAIAEDVVEAMRRCYRKSGVLLPLRERPVTA
jgi:hypothetical protein